VQLEALKLFCDVARTGNISEAARDNYLTQSAASQIVLQLERRLGVQLVDRSRRPLELTEAGHAYYTGCKKLIDEFSDLEASIRGAEARMAGTVQVAAIYSVGLGDMGQYKARFEAKHPNAHVHIEYLHPDRVYEKVLDGSADFGLVSFPKKSRELTAIPWRDEEMVLACPPAHPLADLSSVRPDQLDGEKYVGFDKDLVIRRQVDRFLRDQGVNVQVALEFDNIENIKKAVEVSAGVALLPKPTLQREVQAGTLVAVPLQACRFIRPLGIIQRHHHKLGSTASRFLELLRHSNRAASSKRTEVGSPALGGFAPRARKNGSRRSRNGSARAPKRTV
jgi:DNA-binding transcriptional LysR family regulator